MEYKIIRVINTMIANSNLIGDVYQGGSDSNELYFIYPTKHKWSIKFNSLLEQYFLYYYPTGINLIILKEMDKTSQKFVLYNSGDYKSKEADESFRELYSIVNEKVSGMDSVFRDILNE
jgi:hypothetical protein